MAIKAITSRTPISPLRRWCFVIMNNAKYDELKVKK
jgi:DNA-directed RNA polymerase specialized sigma24 family protein